MTAANSPRQSSTADRLECLRLACARHPSDDEAALAFAVIAIGVLEGKAVEDFAGEDAEPIVVSIPTEDQPPRDLSDSHVTPGRLSQAIVRLLPPVPRVWATMTRLHAKRPEAMKRSQVMAESGLGFRANREAMLELERRGAIRRSGDGKWTRYLLIQPFSEEAE